MPSSPTNPVSSFNSLREGPMMQIVLTVIIFILNSLCYCNSIDFNSNGIRTRESPLPFPPCKADDLDCLRRGLRTFFFLMDSGYLGMKPADPTLVNSVAITLPDQQMSVLLRNVNVTGASWSRLATRKFNLPFGKSGVIFFSDFHVSGEIIMKLADRIDPHIASITIDIDNVETNITYPWTGRLGIDNEDYISIGTERIAVRNTKAPTHFILPLNEDTRTIDETLHLKPTILDHLTNEIVAAVMHNVVDNFRQFAKNVPVKYYYQYYRYY